MVVVKFWVRVRVFFRNVLVNKMESVDQFALNQSFVVE